MFSLSNSGFSFPGLSCYSYYIRNAFNMQCDELCRLNPFPCRKNQIAPVSNPVDSLSTNSRHRVRFVLHLHITI